MRKFSAIATAAAAASLLLLTACGSGRDSASSSEAVAASGTEAATGGAAAPGGFAADSIIGVALPSKTSENWVLAGDLFVKGLTAAGFTPDVQYAAATGTVADQQSQIQSMVTKGAKVIIIGAADGSQLVSQVAAAKAAGAIVIAYDRLILNTADVDYYAAYDNLEVGKLQGQALLDGMKAKKAQGPYNIELFSGSADDANAPVFFQGAMSVLQPAIDAGDVVVGSGQVDIKQTATDGWKAENAQRRMDSLLTSTYTDKELDGVLSPNDTLARAIITSIKGAGKDIPIVTGQDSEVESVKSIMAGEQYSTINKDTRKLVTASIQMVTDLSTGKAPVITDTTSYNNGVKVVPAQLLKPIIVTKENAAEAYADDPTLGPLTK